MQTPEAIAAETVTATEPPRHVYRGWSITWDYGFYTATGPDYDASYEGEEDGWVDNGQRVQGRTYDDCCDEVNAWFEGNKPLAALSAQTEETKL